jgi:hypothetical protein
MPGAMEMDQKDKENGAWISDDTGKRSAWQGGTDAVRRKH